METNQNTNPEQNDDIREDILARFRDIAVEMKAAEEMLIMSKVEGNEGSNDENLANITRLVDNATDIIAEALNSGISYPELVVIALRVEGIGEDDLRSIAKNMENM